LRETMRTFHPRSSSADTTAPDASPGRVRPLARLRISANTTCTRLFLVMSSFLRGRSGESEAGARGVGAASTHTPFSHSASSGKEGLAVIVVMAFRSSWFSVTETLLLMGVLRPTSFLPQYLMHAMFVGALCVTEIEDEAISCGQGSTCLPRSSNQSALLINSVFNRPRLPIACVRPYVHARAVKPRDGGRHRGREYARHTRDRDPQSTRSPACTSVPCPSVFTP